MHAASGSSSAGDSLFRYCMCQHLSTACAACGPGDPQRHLYQQGEAAAAAETAKDEAETGGMEPEPQPQEEGIPPEVAVLQAQEQQWRETRYGRWQKEQHSEPGLGVA